MRYLTTDQVERLHTFLIEQFGGSYGIRDRGALNSSVKQPQPTFGGNDLYPTLEDKAAVIAFMIVKNHPFVDGNKRTGHAAMEAFLLLNGFKIEAEIDEQEEVILKTASGEVTREELAVWIKKQMTVSSKKG